MFFGLKKLRVGWCEVGWGLGVWWKRVEFCSSCRIQDEGFGLQLYGSIMVLCMLLLAALVEASALNNSILCFSCVDFFQLNLCVLLLSFFGCLWCLSVSALGV